ncbi:MAG: hypothetical protein KGI52_18250, partial [Burkholderiales bacterium]|nr:hypothetical protein [Burkholderiales bacterium]
MAILTPVPNTLANNTVADATLVMANFNAIVAGVNAGAAESGNNASITALLGLTTPISAAQGGTQLFSAGTAGGTANALTVTTVTPSTGFVYQAGATVVFTAGLTNSGPATAAVNGTTATAINFNNNSGLSPLVGGELILGARVVMTLATNSGP